MGRKLSEFFVPNALSHKAFFAKHPKKPVVVKIMEVEQQPVKKGGEEVLALHLNKPDVWIVCNRTNADRIAKKFGDDVDDWLGKNVRLNSQPTGYQGMQGFLIEPV